MNNRTLRQVKMRRPQRGGGTDYCTIAVERDLLGDSTVTTQYHLGTHNQRREKRVCTDDQQARSVANRVFSAARASGFVRD